MTPTRVYLAAMYADTRNMTPISVNGTSGFANKTQNFEVVAQYLVCVRLWPTCSRRQGY